VAIDVHMRLSHGRTRPTKHIEVSQFKRLHLMQLAIELTQMSVHFLRMKEDLLVLDLKELLKSQLSLVIVTLPVWNVRSSHNNNSKTDLIIRD